jgi:hypothetical protein
LTKPDALISLLVVLTGRRRLTLTDEEPTMGNTSYFERLVASVEQIARHAYFPGKGEAVDQCLDDLEDLVLAGRITAEQRGVLHEALLSSFPRPALHAACI